MKTRLIWDRVALELVDPAEYARRQEARKPHIAYELPRAVERGHWVYDRATGQVVDAETYYASRPRVARSALAAPAIQSDFNDYVLNHADGKRYSSKGAYRQALKDNGCIEVGTEKIGTKPRVPAEAPGLRDDIKRAMWENGYSL